MQRVRLAALSPVAVSLVVLGALAGCGSDGSDPATQPTATVTETVTVTPSPTEPTTSPTETVDPSDAVPPAVDLTQPPTSYDEALDHVTAGGDARELATFQSDDQTFYCSFGDEYFRPSCEILGSIQDPETCADSPSSGVGRLELTRRGWAPFCNTDTIRQPGAAVLSDRSVASWPDEAIQCVLEDIGLTCLTTDSEQGFFLGPGRYQIF